MRKPTDSKGHGEGKRNSGRNKNKEASASLQNEQKNISILELQKEDIEDLPDREYKESIIKIFGDNLQRQMMARIQAFKEYITTEIEIYETGPN